MTQRQQLGEPRKAGWVAAARVCETVDGLEVCFWEYWTGEFGERGGPSRTRWRGLAHHWPYAREGYAYLGWNSHLFDKDQWKVIESKPGEDR